MKRKFIVGVVIFGIVFSVVVIDFNGVKADTEIRFRGTAIEYDNPNGGGFVGAPVYWIVRVEKIISGPKPCTNNLNVYIGVDWPVEYGYVDPTIKVGDEVEVYGAYFYGSSCECGMNIFTDEGIKNSYYIKK